MNFILMDIIYVQTPAKRKQTEQSPNGFIEVYE